MGVRPVRMMDVRHVLMMAVRRSLIVLGATRHRAVVLFLTLTLSPAMVDKRRAVLVGDRATGRGRDRRARARGPSVCGRTGAGRGVKPETYLTSLVSPSEASR